MNRKNLSDSRRGGFTLVEVCTTVVLFSIVVSGVLGAQAMSLNLMHTAKDTSVATADAQAALEELLLEPIDEVTTKFGSGLDIARWDDLHLNQQRIFPLYPNMAGPDVPDPLEIQVVVNWVDFAGRERNISVTTAKTR